VGAVVGRGRIDDRRIASLKRTNEGIVRGRIGARGLAGGRSERRRDRAPIVVGWRDRDSSRKAGKN
jgi:hypothetical protein